MTIGPGRRGRHDAPPLSSKMIGSSAAGPFFEVVFALLVTELAIIGMLCVPVPGGLLRPVVRWVSTSSMLASLAKPLIWFGTLVGLSFLFTTREMLKLQEEYHDAKEYHDLGQKLQEDPNPNPNPNPDPNPSPSPSPSPNPMQHESRMFRAQRNFYLTGFCLVLLVVIGRVYTLLKQAPNPNPNPNPHPHPNADPLHAAQAGEQAGGHHRGAQKAGGGRGRRVQGHVR